MRILKEAVHDVSFTKFEINSFQVSGIPKWNFSFSLIGLQGFEANARPTQEVGARSVWLYTPAVHDDST